jgi:hypothetical protein
MAKLFTGLAIVLMLGAAVLAFLSKASIDNLQGRLKETKQSLAREESTRQKAEGELKTSKEELAVANTKVEQQTTELAALKKDKDDLTTQVAEAKTALEAKVKELEVAMANNKPGNDVPQVNPNAMAEVEKAKADLAKAQADLAEKNQLFESAKKSSTEKEEQLAEAKKEIERYRAGVTKSGLTGRILAVNPGWNFVVLSVGDRQGAATGGVMIVTRGGEPIGKVRITSIEPSTSIADLVPGSVRRGISIQPGDTVVYEGQRSKPNPNALGATAPNATAPTAVPAP